ncbi:UDP-3-O-(3-hydroxymyristoyl)glucosamine N-acyltransferase [Candidatus Babeliales bacterium]|nr:UDP-3-O-(3-hydroxymyristoyl)glucosamine N-acyltransferase [Candidatus Babeliales bacterium]
MHLNLSVAQIKRIIGGECSLDDSFIVEKISSFESAGKNDLSVLIDRGDKSVFDAVSLENIKKSGAGLILSKTKVISGKKYFLTSDPLGAFNKLVEFIENKNNNENKNFTCEPTCPPKLEERRGKPSVCVSETAVLQKGVIVEANAVIQDEAHIGLNSFVGSHVFIGKNVVIGSNVKLYSGVKILDRCCVGDNTIIHSGAVVGSDGFGYSVTKSGLRKIPQIGIVRIGKDVEIGANCCIDRATFDQTIIGDGVKIDNSVHVAHNVKIGDHSVILSQTVIAGSVNIGVGCQIGGQVAIKDHVNIGNGVKIVSKSAVMKDLSDGEIVCGIPSMPFGQWKRVNVIISRLPEFFKEFGKIKSFLKKAKEKRRFFSRFF